MSSFLENALRRQAANEAKKNQETQETSPKPTVNNPEQQAALLKRIQGALEKTPAVFADTENKSETTPDNADKNLKLESYAQQKADILAEIESIKSEFPMAESSELAERLSSLEANFRTAKAQERFGKYIPDYKPGDEEQWTSVDLKTSIDPKVPEKTASEIATEEDELNAIKIAAIESNPDLKDAVVSAINKSKEYGLKVNGLQNKVNAYNEALTKMSLSTGDSKMVPIAENLRKIHGGATEKIQESQTLQTEKITLGPVGKEPFPLGKQLFDHFNKI